MVKTLCFHCRRCGFGPWSGSWDLTCQVVQPKQQEQKVFYLLFSSLYKILVMGRSGDMVHILRQSWGSDRGGVCPLHRVSEQKSLAGAWSDSLALTSSLFKETSYKNFKKFKKNPPKNPHLNSHSDHSEGTVVVTISHTYFPTSYEKTELLGTFCHYSQKRKVNKLQI